MKRYPETALWDEIAFLAYHLHWSFDDLLDLEHRNRTRMVRRITELDKQTRDRSKTPTG